MIPSLGNISTNSSNSWSLPNNIEYHSKFPFRSTFLGVELLTYLPLEAEQQMKKRSQKVSLSGVGLGELLSIDGEEE